MQLNYNICSGKLHRTHTRQVLLFLSLFIVRNSEQDKTNLVSEVLSHAVRNTTNVWHTILRKSKMLEKQWTMHPLI